ncbi:MAG: hypothetical protein R2848_05820 [Thermomicrobiales bacterium]
MSTSTVPPSAGTWAIEVPAAAPSVQVERAKVMNWPSGVHAGGEPSTKIGPVEPEPLVFSSEPV